MKSSYLTVYTSRYRQKHVSASLVSPSLDPPPSLGLFNPHWLTSSQDQILVELQNNLMLVKADLRRKAETLAQVKSVPLQHLPSGSDPAASPGLCKKRGRGAAVPCSSENRPPLKRPFFPSLFPPHTYSRWAEEAKATPYTRILRCRQPSPPRSPASTPRSLRGKYWAFLHKHFTHKNLYLCIFGSKCSLFSYSTITWSLWIIFGNWG